jgi:hypothetical protein
MCDPASFLLNFSQAKNTKRGKYLSNKQHFGEATAVHHHSTTTLPRTSALVYLQFGRKGLVFYVPDSVIQTHYVAPS